MMEQLAAISPSRLRSEDLTLRRDEVHVWLVRLVALRSEIDRWEKTLASDELERADRFRFLQDRERFILARGTLRSLLGSYLRFKPNKVRFIYGPKGKPALDGESGAHALRFNASHSEGLLLIGFARGREVGIDIERIRPGTEHVEIPEYLFSSREVAALRSLHPSRQLEAFFNCWTRKEAYAKAIGEGMSRALDQFEVSLKPEDPAALLRVEGDCMEASRWSMRALAPGPGYAAAVVVEGHDWRLKSCR